MSKICQNCVKGNCNIQGCLIGIVILKDVLHFDEKAEFCAFCMNGNCRITPIKWDYERRLVPKIKGLIHTPQNLMENIRQHSNVPQKRTFSPNRNVSSNIPQKRTLSPSRNDNSNIPQKRTFSPSRNDNSNTHQKRTFNNRNNNSNAQQKRTFSPSRNDNSNAYQKRTFNNRNNNSNAYQKRTFNNRNVKSTKNSKPNRNVNSNVSRTELHKVTNCYSCNAKRDCIQLVHCKHYICEECYMDSTNYKYIQEYGNGGTCHICINN